MNVQEIEREQPDNLKDVVSYDMGTSNTWIEVREFNSENIILES